MVEITTDNTTRKIVEDMAAQIQASATEAINLYTTGIQVEAAATLIAAGIAVLLGAVAALKIYRLAMEEGDEKGDALLGGFMTGVIVSVIAGGVLDMVVDQVVRIIVPEYTLMQEVIQNIR